MASSDLIAVPLWFESWTALLRIAVFSAVTYVALTALIRLYGKRTISKMNPGDFVITVAIGSVAGSMIVFTEVPVANGLAALASLLGMQFIAERMTSRWPRLRRVVDGSPMLLVHRGELLRANMAAENVDEEDIFVALRKKGFARLDEVEAVVLEIGGGFSVVSRKRAGSDALDDVQKEA
jgi:uncharacterized membrane protein YcaP (DUF421 family)